MRFLIAGATGFLGGALRDHLAREGHHVVRLVRGEAVSHDESHWDADHGVLDQKVIENADVVVNLAGASFVKWPLTEAYKRAFVASRVVTTRVLAEAIARSSSKPAFLAQNGTSYYGDRGDEVLTEESAEGDDGTFLNGITKQWQAATQPAVDAGARVCVMRTSAVLDRRGGAFRPLYLVFKAGLGGPVGDGTQYFSTISLGDWLRAVTFLATHDECSGAYNLTGPQPTTNAEFGRELGRMLHRPTVLRVPATPLRKVLPELSPELLSSVRVEPARLQEAGFRFDHPAVNARLAAALTG
ncbi:MAG TPA: TIGR01777 family oxidoreductase [Nocardioidaceae bacterium]|nr:TIGR01777 family oxidoreductase [Nocardioidaceae bacterium]